MAGNLNAGFTNNINTISIRTAGTSVQRVTDRAIDIDGDGVKESVTVTTPNGQTVIQTVSVAAGSARSVLEQTVETDGGVDTSGTEFSEGNG